MAVDPEFGLKRAQTGQESAYVERVIGTIRRECLAVLPTAGGAAVHATASMGSSQREIERR